MDPQSAANMAAIGIGNVTDGQRIINSRHPDYDAKIDLWTLYRSAWLGGRQFINKYTYSYTSRETPQDFDKRKKASHCPAISKGCVNQIKNSISQRTGEINRKGGPKNYLEACNGDKQGVDKLGSSMTTFINKQILPELGAMGKVGAFLDKMPLPERHTKYDEIDIRPYLYVFKCEDILNWSLDETGSPNEFTSLLLRENYVKKDKKTGLPLCCSIRYRLFTVENKVVTCQYYDEKGNLDGDAITLEKMTQIPFIVWELNESLLTDIADYQVSLLNLSSSDMSYALLMNFPFYHEQYDPNSESEFYKNTENTTKIDQVIPGDAVRQQNDAREIVVGVSKGRRYPKGVDAPGFTNPSAEPLKVSMELQRELKSEIKEILSLTLSNVTATSVKPEEQGNKDLESGLANIGLELEHGERRIPTFWSMYEGSKETATVSYPKNYSLITEQQRRTEAKEINELKSSIPSVTYQKEIAKQTVQVLFRDKLPNETIKKIEDEIDAAKTMTCNYEEIASDSEHGFVGDELASLARGYPVGEVEKAKKDRAEKLALMQAAQSTDGALKNPESRGIIDKAIVPDAKLEKQASITDATGAIDKTKQRGDGK